jgi:MFS family permease
MAHRGLVQGHGQPEGDAREPRASDDPRRDSDDHEAEVRRRSLTGLNGVNFFVADMLTGFGPFVSVYLAANAWRPEDIGFALSLGTIAAVAAQVPAGMLVDAVSQKRAIVAAGILGTIAGAVLLAAVPDRWPVMGAEIMQGFAASLLTPGIAAVTLALSRQEKLGERLGANLRFKALGGMLTALLMGYIGSHISAGAVFYVAAAFGCAALVCLLTISGVDIKAAPLRTDHPTAWPRKARREPLRPQIEIWRDRRLIILGMCGFLFQLGNAAVLPFAFSSAESGGGTNVDTFVALAIIVSQAVAVLVSPATGRLAQARGRRVVLLGGFVALALHCVLLAVFDTRLSIVCFQLLDGLSAASFGVLIPLIVADITRRGGRFNLALGIVGLAMTAGATLSTLLAGFVTEQFGVSVTFLLLGAAALGGCLVILFLLPETQHRPRPVLLKEFS